MACHIFLLHYPSFDVYFIAGVRRMSGHMRLSFGRGNRQSLLHLIDRGARECFFSEIPQALRNHEDVRIEVAETVGLTN